ncbi:hypothetical protein U9M48_019663 [Paspalum notatum var. saurae]|uniref:Retrotransposon protein, putative, unclassified n=1 Tax=Paspalum notatum var. saurae TaxID=547442 RepID=A0AAQ3WRR6_PASNO
MEDVWIMDSGCSRHMTGHRKWFSSLNPISTKEYITFGNNGQGKVMGVGSVSLSAKLSLREVAFVRNLGFNLVSVSQLLDEGFEVHFKKGACCVLDAEETLVCSLLAFGQVFRVDLTSVSGPVRCLVASPSADIWKWHRRLGHLSFDLLVRLSSMGLIRGLPKLRAEKDLVCHPCRHGKMVAASHISVSQVMMKKAPPIFEDEEGAVDVGDAGATAPAAAPALSATSSDDEGGPLPMASSSLLRQQAQAEVGPAEDAGEQMDVKSAFLNGFIEEEVYVRQPPGFESARFPDRVYKLRKALYGLKQAPRAWYARLKSFLLKSGFVMGSVEKTLFLLSRGGDTLIVQIYVDDIIFGGSSHALVSSFAEQMSREFEMSLMGELQFFLGLQIKKGPEGTFVHQAKYTRDILKKFEMGDSKPMTTPMSTNTALDADEDGEAVDQKEFRGMIGSLLYLTATRPDIQFAVCLCARYQASPRTSHRQAVKRIFRYLKFTPELGLWYSSGSSLSLRRFSDADHAGCRIDRKSTSSTFQLLRTSLVSWSSRKQASVSLSTTEAEYIAAASCCSQLLWMKATLSDFGLRFGKIPLLVDSTSAISVAKNPVLHSTTKHIDVRFHFLRDHYEKRDIDLVHVASENQVADIFTKPLEFGAFVRLRGAIHVGDGFYSITLKNKLALDICYRLKVLTMHSSRGRLRANGLASLLSWCDE